jgi:hypothetical protein
MLSRIVSCGRHNNGFFTAPPSSPLHHAGIAGLGLKEKTRKGQEEKKRKKDKKTGNGSKAATLIEKELGRYLQKSRSLPAHHVAG